jgi:hypothetical protein
LPGHVEEDRDATVGFGARRCQEPDASVVHPLVGGLEVVSLQEEADTSGGLLAHDRGLIITVSSREQDACLGTGRANDHPPLRVPGVRHRWRVLDQLEAEGANEERDRQVVVVDHDRNQL